MSKYRCSIHGDLSIHSAWVYNNKVICSKCGVNGESVKCLDAENEPFDKLMGLLEG